MVRVTLPPKEGLSWNIVELGAIGELVGGMAVIGSFLYVGLQIRQNTRAVKRV